MTRLALIATMSFLGTATAHAATYGDVAACAAGSTTPALLAWFDGLKDRKGKLRLELFPSNDQDFLADDFLLEKAGKPFRRIELATPAAGPVAICIRAPGPGRYSFAMIHDRDGKRKFTFSSDGIGFPGNPKLGWSKPKAAKATATLGDGVTEIHVRLNYFSGIGFSPIKEK
ncbi:MAG: DUF2141 domain-containing protein [Sphingomonadales bacterium]|nr:DUF2141 domain-containing protein [Sphingomonadales bacterium]